MFMIDCVNGKAIRSHSQFSEENEILLMSGSYFRVIDQYSPVKDLYIIHSQETTAPYELLKPPFKVDLSASTSHTATNVEKAPESESNSHGTMIESSGKKFNPICWNTI